MPPEWDSENLQDHFHRHRRRLAIATIAEYEDSSRRTIELGTRFNFRNPSEGLWRIGYYDRATRLLTVVNDVETEIVTHFRCNERYVENLPGSDYS